jgi:hypothetical protein
MRKALVLLAVVMLTVVVGAVFAENQTWARNQAWTQNSAWTQTEAGGGVWMLAWEWTNSEEELDCRSDCNEKRKECLSSMYFDGKFAGCRGSDQHDLCLDQNCNTSFYNKCLSECAKLSGAQ